MLSRESSGASASHAELPWWRWQRAWAALSGRSTTTLRGLVPGPRRPGWASSALCVPSQGCRTSWRGAASARWSPSAGTPGGPQLGSRKRRGVAEPAARSGTDAPARRSNGNRRRLVSRPQSVARSGPPPPRRRLLPRSRQLLPSPATTPGCCARCAPASGGCSGSRASPSASAPRWRWASAPPCSPPPPSSPAPCSSKPRWPRSRAARSSGWCWPGGGGRRRPHRPAGGNSAPSSCRSTSSPRSSSRALGERHDFGRAGPRLPEEGRRAGGGHRPLPAGRFPRHPARVPGARGGCSAVATAVVLVWSARLSAAGVAPHALSRRGGEGARAHHRRRHLTYRYPAHTGLLPAPSRAPPEVSSLAGTEVKPRPAPTATPTPPSWW